MQDLARKIAADGEGASKLMTCTVKGAKDEETAEVLAKSIAGSSLTKAQCSVPMRTGDAFSARWAIPELRLTRRKC